MNNLDLRKLTTFGDVAAEEDTVLDYFLQTAAVSEIRGSKVLLSLGRKGSGKTALVRFFAEEKGTIVSRPLNLGGYPWAVHAERTDHGAAAIEAYVASWRFLIAVEFALLAFEKAPDKNSPDAKAIRLFAEKNYGGVNAQLKEILAPEKLKLEGTTLEPQVLGNKLVSISFKRGVRDKPLGSELDALSEALLQAARTVALESGLEMLQLHFDELDQGITNFDDSRKQMLTGLILAARSVRQAAKPTEINLNPVVYLRSDLWDDLVFSDKNKITQSTAFTLEWTPASLMQLVNIRLGVRLGKQVKWADISTARNMRGSQSKWSHILARTFLRPRDVISFLNFTLDQVKKRSENFGPVEEPVIIDNEDITYARDAYSRYLKSELDDEIIAHRPQWDEALQACSGISTLTFDRMQFISEYDKRRSVENGLDAADALKMLYRFSVLGYERRSGYGGTTWAFQYTHPEAGWDNSANLFKVHLGLKEYARLREERVQGLPYEVESSME